MKKFFLLCMLLIGLALTTNAETIKFQATGFALSPDGVTWPEWTVCKIKVTVDNSINRLVIYSKNNQIIDYANFKQTDYEDHCSLTAKASDSNQKSISMARLIYNDETILLIRYSDLQYMYRMVLTPQ